MNAALVCSTVVLTLSAAGSGALLWGTRARWSGSALLASAVTLGLAVVCGLAHAGMAAVGSATATGVLWVFAMLAYPSVALAHPVEWSAWLAAVAAGLVVVAQPMSVSVRSGAVVVLALAVVVDVVWRYDRSAADGERLPLLWLFLGAGVASVVYGLLAFLAPDVARSLGPAVAAVVPPALVAGVRRPSVVDVRALAVSTVVFAVAVLSYVALFVGMTATFEWFGVERLPIGALACIAAISSVGFHPLRLRLRVVIDELLFGGRPDPLKAAGHVVARLGDDPARALADIREALVLPYAGLSIGGQDVAETGLPIDRVRRFPLAVDDQNVELVVGVRRGDRDLTADDERVLQIVAPLLAQTLRAQSLTADLAASRGQAIAAIEEERRRLRRDLHDGLGPTLSGIAFKADAARNSLGNEAAADELLRSLRRDATAAIGEIRRLVYGMRPPALDELGLVPALQQWALQVRAADGGPFVVDIETSGDLVELPAAVEVAAYRIVVEAITNAARHSGSHRAHARLAAGESNLAICVRDEGRPAAPPARADRWSVGVGISSMHERAAEVGGTLTAASTERGGVVTAIVPLP